MEDFNRTLASRIGIEQIEANYDAVRLGKIISSLVEKRKSMALLKDNFSTFEKIEYQLGIIYQEIDEVVKKRMPFFLLKHSRKITKILRNAILGKDIEEGRKSIARQVFGDIPKEIIDRIIRNQNVPARIMKALQRTRMTPRAYAQVIVIQKDPVIRASLVSNYFNMVRNTAYTVTRTSAASMMSQVRMENYGAIPKDLVAFQVHGILDDRIRPAHRERNGTIYFKNPRYNQIGMDQMPNPPLEADGTTAFNCRCWLTPILSSLSNKFYDFKGRIIPNASVFDQWFNSASKELKIMAIGIKRYGAASKRLRRGEILKWHHLLDPESGMLLDEKEISNEKPNNRSNRIKKAKNLISKG